MDINYDIIIFINTSILRRPRVANFADIIKIIIIFIKTILKDSKKSQKNLKLFTKMQSISVFLDIAKFPDFSLKKLMFAELNWCVT